MAENFPLKLLGNTYATAYTANHVQPAEHFNYTADILKYRNLYTWAQ